MNDELKPCAHCGNSDHLMVERVEGETVSPDNFQVVCGWLSGGCGASGGVRRTQAEAIEAWNRRADDATCKAKQAEAEVESLKRANRIQADSFLKIERENRELHDACGELERTIENMRGME